LQEAKEVAAAIMKFADDYGYSFTKAQLMISDDYEKKYFLWSNPIQFLRKPSPHVLNALL